jgi:hypothetical protein
MAILLQFSKASSALCGPLKISAKAFGSAFPKVPVGMLFHGAFDVTAHAVMGLPIVKGHPALGPPHSIVELSWIYEALAEDGSFLALESGDFPQKSEEYMNGHFKSNLKANKTDKSLWSPHLVSTRYENELFEEIKRDPDLGLRPIVDAAVQSAFCTTQITKHAVSIAALSPSYVESKLIEPPYGDLVKAGVQTCLKRRKLLPNKGKPYSGEAEAAYAIFGGK